MARVHAASACVQSNSIKGLAQSIAKPAYHRLLLAEPALRRAVPTLIIAFLITICLGAFVQVIDQNRQKRTSIKRDLAAVAELLAERIDRITSVRQDRAASFERLQLLLPGLIPSWAVAAGRHVIVTGMDQRILARIPIECGDWRGQPRPRCHQCGAAAEHARAARRRDRHHPAERQRGAGGPARHQIAARSGDHHSGEGRFDLALGRSLVGDAFRHHRLCRADPGLRVPLAIDPRTRGRSDQ